MIKTVLEETAGATKIAITKDCGHYEVHLLNGPRGIMVVYGTGGHIESDRTLNQRELDEIINLCEWCINVLNAKGINKRTIAKVANNVIWLLYKGGNCDD